MTLRRSLAKCRWGQLLPFLRPRDQYLVEHQPESHGLGGEVAQVGHVTPVLQLKGNTHSLLAA